MRLSTERDRDDDRSVAVLHAALDAGITLVDTSDAYCWDATEAGHNERLIARALSTWPGDRSRITIATKGGLTRPNGQWIPDGRAKHLAVACAASVKALGLDRIPLYQLHAPDPKVPLSTSVRALDALRRDGLIDAVGLCNVSVAQIEEAQAIGDIASVQVELNPWNDANVLNGVLEYCVAHKLRLLAFRPLGGAKGHRRIEGDTTLATIADSHQSTPFEIVLAWIAGLAPAVVPVPGPTRVTTAQSIGRAARITLTDEERKQLDEHFPAGRAFRFRESSQQRQQPITREGEIVMVMGLPAAGKSTIAKTLVARGYTRVNRDEAGGTLRALVPQIDKIIADGSSRIVLDNTYVSRKARAPVIQAAWKTGLSVRGIWLATSLEDAQVNAATRMVVRHGRLLSPEEMKAAVKTDVSAFGPSVQFRYQRELEMPDTSEGFARVDIFPFVRRHNPTATNRAIIVWCDSVLARSISGHRTPESPDDFELVEGRADVLRRYDEEGWYILGMSWQPGIAAKTTTHEQVFETFARMREEIGVEMDVEYCPHEGGPPICWCRKPLPGLGVAFIQRYRLDPRQCIYVGTGAQDESFARRLDFQFREATEFFRL